MTRIPSIAWRTAAVLMMLLSTALHAQQAEEFGPYRVHYNAINTNLLNPEVARAYSIQRSGNRAMLSIAVIRHDGESDTNSAVHADVTASAINLTGQRRHIELDTIEDQEAIYYIGTFRIHDEETLDFTVQVRPEDEPETHEFGFRQQFFTDD